LDSVEERGESIQQGREIKRPALFERDRGRENRVGGSESDRERMIRGIQEKCKRISKIECEFDRREKPGGRKHCLSENIHDRGGKLNKKDECDEVEAELC
jgi:hypothetical protein